MSSSLLLLLLLVLCLLCLILINSLITLETDRIGKERNVLFNDKLNTFYLQLYGVGHMVKDHSDSERGNLFICFCSFDLSCPILEKR